MFNECPIQTGKRIHLAMMRRFEGPEKSLPRVIFRHGRRDANLIGEASSPQLSRFYCVSVMVVHSV
uniref:Uncharacterized protein n=1 Tax=Rhizophora mucronata TaxID=61149 RepID=A0A2P2PF23_RHIMU